MRPQIADREDGLQIWRAAANIMNKQLQRADSGWSSSLGVEWRANNLPLYKKQFITKYLAEH
jgi:hypothetical protein